MTNQEDNNWKAIVEKAMKVGFKEVPVSTSALEIKVVQLFKDTKQIMSAKAVHGILGEKEPKWYSDKLWFLAKKQILVCVSRGYYKLA